MTLGNASVVYGPEWTFFPGAFRVRFFFLSAVDNMISHQAILGM